MLAVLGDAHRLSRRSVQAAALALPATLGLFASSASALSGAASAPTRATAAPAPVRISSAVCVPASECSSNKHEVSVHGTLRLEGVGLRSGMLIAFPLSSGGSLSSRSPTAQLRRTGIGLIVGVPEKARSGKIAALLADGAHSSSVSVTIVPHALHPTIAPTSASGGASVPTSAPTPGTTTTAGAAVAPGTTATPVLTTTSPTTSPMTTVTGPTDVATTATVSGPTGVTITGPTGAVAPPVSTTGNASAFDGDGMWIWYVSKSDQGNVASIETQAKKAGIGTLYIKSSDGTNYWSQFSAQLVSELHASGLKVCAWQYVYGASPVAEAAVGAEAVANGADCLVIDAESEYEGRYGPAQQFLAALRAKIGAAYPLGLTSFPYANFHPAFPYSVFLGPQGAQFNLPQMYWKDIGASVAEIFAKTYEQNLIYGRPIFPLGQSFESPTATEMTAFRSLASAYGAGGISFWDWQETSAADWSSLPGALDPSLHAPAPEATSPLLKDGAEGDQVLWMQEHLASAIPTQETDGIFGPQTKKNLEQFQTSHGLAPSGQTTPETWSALLALTPVSVTWTGSPKATAARAHKPKSARVMSAPLSARLGPLRGPTG